MGDWNATVPTFVVGKLRAADQVTMTDIATALTTTPSTWVPTLTNLTLGNGTQTAVYRRLGKAIDWYWQFLLGSTSAVGTAPTFTLPVAPAATYPLTNPQFPSGVHLLQTGTTERQGALKISAGSTVQITFWNATPALASVTATTPWTWATGHYITAWGFYWAA